MYKAIPVDFESISVLGKQTKTHNKRMRYISRAYEAKNKVSQCILLNKKATTKKRDLSFSFARCGGS